MKTKQKIKILEIGEYEEIYPYDHGMYHYFKTSHPIKKKQYSAIKKAITKVLNK